MASSVILVKKKTSLWLKTNVVLMIFFHSIGRTDAGLKFGSSDPHLPGESFWADDGVEEVLGLGLEGVRLRRLHTLPVHLEDLLELVLAELDAVNRLNQVLKEYMLLPAVAWKTKNARILRTAGDPLQMQAFLTFSCNTFGIKQRYFQYRILCTQKIKQFLFFLPLTQSTIPVLIGLSV